MYDTKWLQGGHKMGRIFVFFTYLDTGEIT